MDRIEIQKMEDSDLLREAFETAADPIVIIIQQKMIWVNMAFQKLLGWTKEETIGKDFTIFTMDTTPMKNYVKGLTRQKTEDFYPAKLKGKHGPVDVKVCSTKIYIKGQYGRLVMLK